MCRRVLRPAITFERFELGSTYTVADVRTQYALETRVGAALRRLRAFAAD